MMNQASQIYAQTSWMLTVLPTVALLSVVVLGIGIAVEGRRRVSKVRIQSMN